MRSLTVAAVSATGFICFITSPSITCLFHNIAIHFITAEILLNTDFLALPLCNFTQPVRHSDFNSKAGVVFFFTRVSTWQFVYTPYKRESQDFVLAAFPRKHSKIAWDFQPHFKICVRPMGLSNTKQLFPDTVYAIYRSTKFLFC